MSGAWRNELCVQSFPWRSGTSDTVDGMARKVRLTDDETEALRGEAAKVGHTMQDVARPAIDRRTTDEDAQFRTLVAAIVQRDQELLDRLAR